MIDITKMIRNGEMSKEFYRKLAEDFKAVPAENNRMRFNLDAPYKTDIYQPKHPYGLTVTEYADICEGETLTAKSVFCKDAVRVIEETLIPSDNRTITFVENQLREEFESLDAFKCFCDVCEISYEAQPLWIDEHSYNEYTGEHRGEFRPFDPKPKESEDKTP